MKKALLFAFVLFWASWVSAREPAILLAPPEDSDFRTWRAELRASGIVLRHAFPPAGGIAFEEETLEIAALELLTPPGTQVWRSSPEGEEAQPIRSTREGDLLWHAHRALLGLEGPFSLPTDPPGEAPENDALAPPHFRPEVACSAASLLKSPAEYMLG